MKPILLSGVFLLLSSSIFGQINPVQNASWQHWYEYPHNFFKLEWEEPAIPHNPIIGYNVYRDNELYTFTTERTLYNFYSSVYGFVSNCNENFLALDNQNQPYENGFYIHVTAVYEPGNVESGYLQSFFEQGPLLTNNRLNNTKTILFPNPTNGIININNQELTKIEIYDVLGKLINEYAPQQQIDLSSLKKGYYLIKLFSESDVAVNRVLLK